MGHHQLLVQAVTVTGALVFTTSEPSQVRGLSLYGGGGRAAAHGPGMMAIVQRMSTTLEDVEGEGPRCLQHF